MDIDERQEAPRDENGAVADLLFNLGGPDTLDAVEPFLMMLFAGEGKRAGIVDYRRTEALDTHPLFIEALARLVERRLEQPS